MTVTTGSGISDRLIIVSSVAEMAILVVPLTVALIFTEYAQTPGHGGANFRRYTGPYAADGFCIVQTADGAKWKATTIPNPQLFGAVPGADITAAMQRWATYAATRKEPEMNWSIQGIISYPVVGTVAALSTDYCKKITGKIILDEPATIVADALITLNNFIQTTGGDGEYLGSILFAARTVYDAFVFNGCKYLDAGDFYVVGCIRHGIQALNYTTEFKFRHVKTLYNGSSKYQGIAFSAPVHFRTGSGTGQRSNFQGFVTPRGIRANDGVMINGNYYHIRIIDTAGTTMQVFPALDAVDLANMSGAYWCFGGGFRHGGGETNTGYIARNSGLVNAVGLICDDLYPVTVGKAVSQLESAQIRIGVDRDSAYRGGAILDSYTENTGIACIILAQGGDRPYCFGQVGQFTPDKSYQFLDYINDDYTKNILRNTPVIISNFNSKSVVPRATQFPELSTVSGNAQITVVAVQEVASGYGKTIKLIADTVMATAHGAYCLAFYVYGTTTGNPGTINLVGETNITVAGQISHAVALTGPTMLFAMFTNNNWTIQKSSTFYNA